MNRKFAWVSILLAFAVVSCGGEGPGLAGGRDGGGTDDPGVEPPVQLNSIELLASSPQLQSDGSNTVTLTAVAKDVNNQVITDVPVTFSATSGSLTVLNSATNEQGIAIAELTTGGDPTNRTIGVEAAVGTVNDALDIDVIGSALQIQGPASLVNGDIGIYTVTLANSAGTGISNRTVQLASSRGNTLSSTTLTTDASGRVQVELTGNVSGTDTLTATALPDAGGTPTVTATTSITVSSDNFRFTTPSSGAEINLGATPSVAVHWEKDGDPQDAQIVRFATTRGTFVGADPSTPSAIDAVTDASGNASAQIQSTTSGVAVITATNQDGTSTQLSIEFVATNPSTVALQADPSVISVNETSTITAVVRDGDNRVKDATVEFTLADSTGGTLSTASSITDSQGRAQTVYTASSVTSADDGVVVTANVIGGANPSATTNLTVSGRALFIVFGTGNTIIEEANDTIYTKDYSLFVSDSSGKGVANTSVNVRMLSTRFYKGFMTAGAEKWEQTIMATCASEDLNSNGSLDAGEDVNGDGEVTPGNVAIVAPGTIVTDEDGRAEFKISYPQDHAMWLDGRITASATVAGTESRKSADFFFPASADDLELSNSPPNPASPWGVTAGCDNAD